jgi:multidrug/hemolysin transport system permease protein
MIKTQNAFGTASSLMGTLIGFLTGIYIPIGNLPSTIQTVIKIFPLSHAVVLMRQVMMGQALDIERMPDEFIGFMGIKLAAGGSFMEPWIHILVLVASTAVFFVASLLVLNRKDRAVI